MRTITGREGAMRVGIVKLNCQARVAGAMVVLGGLALACSSDSGSDLRP